MKKLVMGIALAAILATGTAFADHPDGLGIGIVGFYPGGVGLSLKIPSVPIYWAVNAGIGSNFFAVHLTGDGYIVDQLLAKDIGLNWFFGVGGWFSFYSFSMKNSEYGDYSYTRLAGGARIPIGLSWQPIKLLEIFLDIAPSLGIAFDGKQESNGHVYNDGGIGFAFYWPIELGIRLWF